VDLTESLMYAAVYSYILFGLLYFLNRHYRFVNNISLKHIDEIYTIEVDSVIKGIDLEVIFHEISIHQIKI
jgi:hypothetical protein